MAMEVEGLPPRVSVGGRLRVLAAGVAAVLS